MQYNPQRPQPWPIRLALKFGAKTEAQAQLLVLGTSIILIVISIYLYGGLFSSDTVEPIDPAVLQEMEMMTAQ